MAEAISSAKKPRPALPTLPSEIEIEILTRLPAGKSIARFKCVCKSWLSMIRGAEFQSAYRSRHRGLILYWCEEISDFEKRREYGGSLRVHFYYSPLRQLNEPPPDDCYPLLKMGVETSQGLTQVVNGVCCHARTDSDDKLTLHNVFTGEKMTLRDPKSTRFQYNRPTSSTCHLGYVSMTGEYKILRIVFPLRSSSVFPVNLPLRAQTMVLRPSGSRLKWKPLMYKDSGLADLGVPSKDVYGMVAYQEVRMFSGDGVVCWFDREFGLIMFDFYEEKFRRVKLPKDVERNEQLYVRNWDRHMFIRRHMVRVFIRTRLNGSTSSLALYALPPKGNPECFVLDDYKNNIIGRWRKENVEFPEEIRGLAVAIGDEKLLLMGNQENGPRSVYSYGDDKSVERFMIGNLPYNKKPWFMNRNLPHINKPFDMDGIYSWVLDDEAFEYKFSCLHDSNVVYQSINDVLSHGANDDDDDDDDEVKFREYDGEDGVKWPEYIE